jgi:long-chain fatty acid transport protein
MSKRSRQVVPLAAFIALGAYASGAHPSGFQLVEQNASGLGNAYAGQGASAHDASTIFWNPAGMTRLSGGNFVAAANAIRPSSEFGNTFSTPALFQPSLGGNGGDAGDWAFVPNAYLSWQLTPKWFIGVGLNVPFGLKTEYDPTWAGRFYAVESKLETVNVNPSVAYKVNEQVSLGAGVSWQRADATLSNSVNYTGAAVSATCPTLAPACVAGVLGAVPPGTEGLAKVEGDDSAWGWNAGALFTIGQNTRIGVTYRSAIDYTISGTVAFGNRPAALAGSPLVANGPVTADLKLPATASWSLFHPFDPKWDILADITWTEWSSLDTLNIIRSGTGALLSSLVLNWRDTWRVGIGANYHYNNEWTFRFGTAYDQTPTRDEFRTPRIPDQDRTWLAIGGQYRMSKQAALDFGYAHLFVRDAAINLTPPYVSASTAAANGSLIGTFQNDVNILSVQFRYSF